MQAVTTRTGLYAEPILGSGLDRSGQQALEGSLQEAEDLAQALRDALRDARAGGLGAFAPDDADVWTPPAGLASLKTWFAEVIGRPYNADADANPGDSLPTYGALSLAQWSLACDALEQRIARDRSRLPPGLGGGPQHANGVWYINGQRFTLAEVFLAVRLGNFEATDKYLLDHMKTLVANGELARTVLEVLADMKRLRVERGLEDTADVFDPKADFADFVLAAGIDLNDFRDYGQSLKGDASYIVEAVRMYRANTGETIDSETYGYLMGEVGALFDSLNADNQAKQQQVQSIQNSRTDMLTGISSFMNAVESQNKTIGRNI
jgi:hypothetical protein